MGGGASVGAITTTNESSTVPSSAADSTAEGDRSEDETSKSSKAANYNKKGALQDVTAGKEVKEQPERFIPGLNTSASTSMMPPAKRVQKKRRKKKAAAAAAAAMAAVNSGSADQVRLYFTV